MRQSRSELVYAVQYLKTLARQRHDQIREYQYQQEQGMATQLRRMAQLITGIARQLELAVYRRQISASTAMMLLKQIVVAGNYGEFVYAYILDGDGHIVCHPTLPEGFDLSSYRFVREMLREKDGEIRYIWKNPGELEPTERLVAYRTIRSWNWLVALGVSLDDVLDGSYETRQLQGFFDYVKTLQGPVEVHAMILSEAGEILAHPMTADKALSSVPGGETVFRNPNAVSEFEDTFGQVWIVASTTFPPRKWIIAVAVRKEDALKPFYDIVRWVGTAYGAIVVLSVILLILPGARKMKSR